MIQRCTREGCEAEAKWAPKICVPAIGYAIESHEPLSALIGLALCTYHAASLTPADLFGGPIGSDDEGGAALRDVFRAAAAGRAAPDFARAWIQRVSLKSPEWLILERAQAGRLQ